MSWSVTAARLAAGTAPVLGNSVTIGGVTGRGILRSPEEAVLGDAVVVSGFTLEVPSAKWAEINEGTAVTVDGVQYIARESSRPGSDQSTILVLLELPFGVVIPPPESGGDSWQTAATLLTKGTALTLGNSVVIGGVAGRGILLSPEEAVLNGAVVVSGFMLEIPIGIWPQVEDGEAVTVDGVEYEARESSRPGSDQSTIWVPLELAPGAVLLPPENESASWNVTAARLTAGTNPQLGNSVTIGGVTDYGILHSPEEAVLNGAVVVSGFMLELSFAVWEEIIEGATVTVDGVDYEARESSRPGSDQSTIWVPLELAPTLVETCYLITLSGDPITTLGGSYLKTL